MSGARIELEFDHQQITRALSAGAAALDDPELLLKDLGEMLFNIHRARFSAQVSPDGTPWQALSPGYLRRKERNKDKILKASGQLSNDLRYQIDGDSLLFGTDRPYGAIHQFGGQIERQARASTVYFKMDERTGEVGRKFVPKTKSNFAQDVKIGPYTIEIPARPWLGTSDADDGMLLQRVMTFLTTAMGN
ncbi:phage virion morphogenesis protein [Pseudomonas citronellolis]|uniref:phage virion morphogenesis protein n=1 Tax=Pseudomonas citronellolis TaxID=53408 RepID=UPI0008539A4A|nr:phage virion morphogenesis protein [Pseudomonas humi]